MDSITHVLSAALLTEPLPIPEVEKGSIYARWRLRMAILVGALLPDADGMLGWIDPALYAGYHRKTTHSIIGVVVMILLSALIARKWPEKWLFPFVRRRYQGFHSVQPTFRRLVGFTAISVVVHCLLDWVAKWGIWPLWPFSDRDFALGRVNSLDPVLLGLTVAAWAIQHLFLTRNKRTTAWVVAGFWILAFAAYVWLRPYWGEPAYV